MTIETNFQERWLWFAIKLLIKFLIQQQKINKLQNRKFLPSAITGWPFSLQFTPKFHSSIEMASLSKPSFLSPLALIKSSASPTRRVHPLSIKLAFAPKSLKVSSSLGPFTVESSSAFNSSEELAEPDPAEVEADHVKLAFAKAEAYKKRTESKPTIEIAQNLVDQSAGIDERSEDLKMDVPKSEALRPAGEDNGEGKVPLALKLSFEKAKEYKKNKGVVDESEAVKGSEESSGIVVL